MQWKDQNHVDVRSAACRGTNGKNLEDPTLCCWSVVQHAPCRCSITPEPGFEPGPPTRQSNTQPVVLSPIGRVVMVGSWLGCYIHPLNLWSASLRFTLHTAEPAHIQNILFYYSTSISIRTRSVIVSMYQYVCVICGIDWSYYCLNLLYCDILSHLQHRQLFLVYVLWLWQCKCLFSHANKALISRL